jgi:tripartite-type tricarboxylate transporter receptor subunit TctC
MMSRMRAIMPTVILLASVWLMPASAQNVSAYPEKPVRLVIPLAPGGPSDILGRSIAQKLSEAFGQAFYAENRPGAAGTVGTTVVARAEPDGYTMLLIGQSTYTINASLYATLPFDPRKDLTVVTALAEAPQMVVVHPSLPVNSLRELVAYAKEKPGKLSFASGGTGTGPHLSMELLKEMTGMDIVHIPYKGSGPALNDVVAGRVEVMMVNLIAGLPLVKSGRLRAIAVSRPTRSPTLPDVASVAEQGVPGYDIGGPHLIMVPAATPRPIVDKLNQALIKILALPDVRERLALEGAEVVGNSPDEAQTRMLADIKRWEPIIKRLGLRAN